MKPIGLHLRWAETSAPVLSGACVVPNGSVFGNIINAVAGSSGSGKRGSSSSSASGDLVCSFGGRGSNSSQVLTVFNFGSTGETLKVPLTPFYDGGKKSDAMKSLPAESWGQMFAAIALVEIYELTHKDGKVAYDETVAPGLQPGGLTGDLGWNPLRVKVTDRRRLVELQNGRAAMFAISAWVSADAVAGSVPIPLLW